MNKIEIRSFLDFQFVSTPAFSPDGRYAAFVVQQASVKENKYFGDLWLLDVQAKACRRLTSGGDAKSYIWTRYGTLLFPAVRDETLKNKISAGEELSCWYEISPDGGEAVLAFTLPLFAKALQPVDNDRYIVTATYDNNRPDLSGLEGDERKNVLENLKKPSYEVLEESPFWSNGASFTSGKRQRLYLYTRSTGELTAITDPWFATASCSVFGEKLVYTGIAWQGFKGRESYPGIWIYDLQTAETLCILPPHTMRIGPFALREDGTLLAAATDCVPYGFYQYMDFYTFDTETCERKKVAPYGFSVGSSSVGSDARLGAGRMSKAINGKFYFVSTLDGGSRLRCIDETNVVSDCLTPDGSCDGFDICGDHLLVCGFYDGKLAELYLDGEQVTHFNDKWTASHSVITPEYHSFVDPDGYEIHGWALKPAGYEPGKKYPAILHIHGGPRTVFGTTFHHEMQVWANAGYFVFYCNPRGSDGGGDDFGNIKGMLGTVDYENLMQFADEMLAKYPDVDAEKFGVAGGSYGGFMTNWIIGHTNRFAAAVSQRSISNWVSFEHTSDIGPWFEPDNIAATTRDNMEKVWWHSPLKYADRCKTPTLFIHSDADYRCWMVEGISMFTALKMHGCEARMCLFKGENHELSRSGKPRNRIRRMEEILGWMDKYLK